MAAPGAVRAFLAREQITWGAFDLVVVDHIGMMLPEGKTQRMNQISGDLLKLQVPLAVRVAFHQGGAD